LGWLYTNSRLWNEFREAEIKGTQYQELIQWSMKNSVKIEGILTKEVDEHGNAKFRITTRKVYPRNTEPGSSTNGGG
jgi:hypothetical protein